MSKLDLHVHDDIKEAANYFNIPLALYDADDVYIMQEDRVVFIGNRTAAKRWVELNNGSYCKARF